MADQVNAARRNGFALWQIAAAIILIALLGCWLCCKEFQAATQVQVTPLPAGEAAGKYPEPDAVPLTGGGSPRRR